MKIMSEKDYHFFVYLCQMDQVKIRNVVADLLRKNYHYKTVIQTSDYIYAIGDIPIALAAHSDTVFSHPPTEIYYDKDQNIILSPTGLGADDRAGIFAILKILQLGLRPHIIISRDEEKGCLGAEILSKNRCPFKDLNFIIQLDRRGADDCVFYDCDNREFVEYIETFGFYEEFGSYTDISVLCPEWKVAGVNLSVGYYREHTTTEILKVNELYNTIKKTIKILKTPSKKYDYIPRIYSKWQYSHPEDEICEICGNPINKDTDIQYYDEIDKQTYWICKKCRDYFGDEYLFDDPQE